MQAGVLTSDRALWVAPASVSAGSVASAPGFLYFTPVGGAHVVGAVHQAGVAAAGASPGAEGWRAAAEKTSTGQQANASERDRQSGDDVAKVVVLGQCGSGAGTAGEEWLVGVDQ